jgi:hypothetical protein|tara:strand:+ start:477 stop:833 length:357 start_codon:yes stop_codon:yes gene_type:complete
MVRLATNLNLNRNFNKFGMMKVTLKILKPNCFRIEEHSREYSMSDTIIHNTLEYAETRFRRLIGEYLLGYVRINQGLYMTEFGKKFGYSRMKIPKIENIGYDLSKKELETIHKVLKIK